MEQKWSLLAPLIDAIQKHVLAEDASFMPTIRRIPVLAPGSGKTKTGRLLDLCARRQAGW